MVCDSAFIFPMFIPCVKTFSLVPRSSLFAKGKVKYPGRILKENQKQIGRNF